MKNYLLGILAVLVIVVLLMIGFSGNQVKTNNDESMDTTSEQSTNTGSKNTNSGSVSSGSTQNQTVTLDLFPQKGNYQCTYETVTPDSRSTNVIYLSGGKMRGEFRSSTPDGSIGNMIVFDGVHLYVWTEGMNTGKISDPKSLADFPTIVPRNITEGKILGDGYNSVSWDCHPWLKDTALLAKPSYVTFSY